MTPASDSVEDEEAGFNIRGEKLVFFETCTL
jgi:hypothetical protein